jgi:chromosome segregation ATPase
MTADPAHNNNGDSVPQDELRDQLRKRLKVNLGSGDAHQHIWELTVQLVTLQNARHQAETRLSRALEQIEHLKDRRGDHSRHDGPNPEEQALRRELDRNTSALRETQRSLTESRQRAERLQRQLEEERQERAAVDKALQEAHERLDQMAEVLKDLEAAYYAHSRRRR